MMKPLDISSIGWLNRHDGKITLTACLPYQLQPIFITISMEEFSQIKGSDNLIKIKACEVINNGL